MKRKVDPLTQAPCETTTLQRGIRARSSKRETARRPERPQRPSLGLASQREVVESLCSSSRVTNAGLGRQNVSPTGLPRHARAKAGWVYTMAWDYLRPSSKLHLHETSIHSTISVAGLRGK